MLRRTSAFSNSVIVAIRAASSEKVEAGEVVAKSLSLSRSFPVAECAASSEKVEVEEIVAKNLSLQ